MIVDDVSGGLVVMDPLDATVEYGVVQYNNSMYFAFAIHGVLIGFCAANMSGFKLVQFF